MSRARLPRGARPGTVREPLARASPRARGASNIAPVLHVKVCGVTNVADAEACVAAGVDAVGLNFWSRSNRRCAEDVARRIVEAVGGAVRVVGVFVDAGPEEIRRIRRETGIAWAQLHGDEPPDEVEALLPHAFKALRADGPAVVERARLQPGHLVLLDAHVPGSPGGTGRTFDWSLARDVAAERRLLLAGGLGPHNVGEAVRAVQPWGVDVASGVERSPGVKDPDRIRAFVDGARRG